jgi:hypothetical protein
MKHARRHIRCACCAEGGAATKDHVVPRALYPSSKPRSTVPRITIPACLECNAGLVDDEAHFRNMMLIAGELHGRGVVA